MPKRDTAPVGAPCWVELFTSNVDQAKAFYSELFGWTVDETGAEQFGGYFNFLKDGVRVAGGMGNDGSTETTDTWTIYLATADAKATSDAAAAKGAQIIAPAMEVMDLGSMLVLADPGGAAIGAWQPGTHKGFGIHQEPGTPGWFELHTRDYDTSVAFYRDVFGWDTHVASDEADFRYTTLGEGEAQLAGIMDASAFLPDGVPAQWSVYFSVEDTDKALATIVSLGGSVVEPAMDSPYGRLARAADPTGATFKLVADTA